MYKELKGFYPQQVFIIQGNQETFSSLIEGIPKENQHIESRNINRFTVSEAKDLVEFNLEMPRESWFVVYFDIFVNDAAQILLKTLEEPKEGIYIVFITPHPYLLPQTIRSRARLITKEVLSSQPDYLSSKEKLLDYVKNTFGDEKIDASIRRSQATRFFDEVERSVRDDLSKVENVYIAKDMLFKANMPTKQVVEFLVTMIY